MGELYDRWYLCRNSKGIQKRVGTAEDRDRQDTTNLNANMEKLLAFVTTVTQSGESIIATDKSGNSHTFNAYEVKITINQLYKNREDLTTFPDERTAIPLGGEPIILSAKVYLIDMTNSSEQVIIKVKDKYFVRDAYSEDSNQSDLEKFDGLNAWALIIVADFDRVDDIVLFGNYAQANEALSDETSDKYYSAGFGTGDGMKFLGDKFVVYKPDFLGVTINGTGETKAPLAWSVESSLSIAETGRNENRNTETDIYFSFSSVEIAPVTASDINGLSVAGIQSVEVLDGIPENAVKIEERNGSGKYAVQFLSDYYDTVRIKVTYGLDNGSTDSGIMTLNRVGIMLQGGRTAGDSDTVNIFHGHEMGATLGDGSNAPVKVEAIAVPNANPDGTINGAKLGAGKGVGKTLSLN